jgi:hypothetical protein
MIFTMIDGSIGKSEREKRSLESLEYENNNNSK